MLKLSLVISSSDEARVAISKAHDALSKSNLSQSSKLYLSDAVCRTLALWEDQLSCPTTKSLKADRLFAGDNYRISLRADQHSSGLVGIIKRLLGGG